MTMNKTIRTKCRYCDIDGCLGTCLRKDATRTPADSVPAGAGYAELPDFLICAVDQWFADNIKDSDGCTTQDVRELAEIFYGVTHEGGRESVDDALAIVKSFGPGIGGINDTYARQVLLAEEVERLRGQATNAKKTGELLMGLAVIRELTGTQQKGLEETIEAVRAAVNAQKTSASTSQPGGFDAGDMASAAAQGYRDGWTAAQPVAQQGAAYAALPEPLEIDWPELHSQALGCGVEDRGLHNRYECAEYGWQDGVDKCAERVPEQIFDADQMRAFADATHAIRASHKQAPAQPATGPTWAALNHAWQKIGCDAAGMDWGAFTNAVHHAPTPQADSVLEDALREREEADDFIDTLLDEVLGPDRAEWSSAYGRAEAMEEVRERITALHKPAVDRAWTQFAAADSVLEDAARWNAWASAMVEACNSDEQEPAFLVALDKAIGDAKPPITLELWNEWTDAARKQGANHD